MMVSQERILDILNKINKGEFAVIFTSQKSFKVLGSNNNQVRDYTNDLAFLYKFDFSNFESLLDAQNKLSESKLAKEWRYKEKITMNGYGYDFAGEFLYSLANSLVEIKGLEKYKQRGYPSYTRL